MVDWGTGKAATGLWISGAVLQGASWYWVACGHRATWKHRYIYIYMYVLCIYIYIYVHIYVCMYMCNLWTCSSGNMYIYIHIYVGASRLGSSWPLHKCSTGDSGTCCMQFVIFHVCRCHVQRTELPRRMYVCVFLRINMHIQNMWVYLCMYFVATSHAHRCHVLCKQL